MTTVFLGFLMCTSLPGDTIELTDGNGVTGKILLRRADSIVVDLGYTVIDIPSSAIISISTGDETDDSLNGTGADSHGIFQTESNRQNLTVRENIPRCGAAVVEIRTGRGLGSGFVVDSSGYVVTNDHVVAGSSKISVTIFKESKDGLEKEIFHHVRLLAVNPDWDLALLKIETDTPLELDFVPLGDSEKLRRGQPVFAIGSPMGLSRSVSEGIISRVPVAIRGRLLVQTTAKISPGNSGGPLFNLRGEVIGVTSSKIVAAGAEGLGFAIPAEIVKIFLRNRAAFLTDPDSPDAGFHYNSPPKNDETLKESS